MKKSDLLAGVAKSATYNIILQFSLRIITFFLNAFALRYISRDLLGVVNVRLTLLYSTILFLAKEAFNKACLSQSENKNWQQIINLMWCAVPVGFICCTCGSFIWIYLLEIPDPNIIPYYNIGVIAFAFSTLVEILAEPLVIVGQSFMFVKLKVLFYGLSQGFKCLFTIIMVIYFPKFGIINFCLAQVLSVLIYVILYYGYFTHYFLQPKKSDDFPFTSVSQFLPKTIPGKPFIDTNYASLTWSFFKQSFLKQILTEGEKFVMTFFDVLSFADQGIYDVINNLGSMAARFIFLPIEDTGYLFFSQSLTRGKPIHQQKQEDVKFSSDVLSLFLKIVTLIGCIILTFGYTYSYLALHLYGGTILTVGSGPVLLKWYCLYVLVIAINGTTEGFVFAAMSKNDVDRYNHKMLLFSVLFLLSSWFLTKTIGSVGFILANCLNMAARIIHSMIFIRTYFKESNYKPLHDIIPSLPVNVVILLSFIITYLSEQKFCNGDVLGKVLHVLIGGVCLLVTLATILFTEKKLINFIEQQYYLRKANKKES
ncbi:hypothetical protein LOTGIDRAFT_234090 [Lottia gigantea]|uniref:Protein RFT1 homolog n=1 Tax=Lottia gigantea TaxID=225164 RepID=V4A4S2_LOTGI|nr:hypothetical protein LOTGIDRAFT_234090 [Lottia gigantea]ESO89985.1 hypothetical protein LOTGIDRAFT_234090 [Lottia gigantea]